MVLLIDRLIKAIRDAATYNSDVQVAPHCILWPDKDRQWEPVIPRLQEMLPELFVLGDYDPAKRTGPAIWLRCVIAGQIPDMVVPGSAKAVLYLPNVSRQNLRAVESCKEELKPLAELQYRGTTWTQIANGKDWTVLAFLKSNQGGLGLEVALDQETKNAMLLSLYRLLDEDVSLLEGRHLDKDYFNSLLTERDHVREVLRWLDQGDEYRAKLDKNNWKAFTALCRSQLAFDPEKEGVLGGATRLAKHEGPWQPVWERFCESARKYSNIPGLIRRCQPPDNEMFWPLSDAKYGGWPQWNEEQENKLRDELLKLAETPPHEARARILDLEKKHKNRRSLVWVEFGESPLAVALEYLSILAELTSNGLCAGDCNDLSSGYQTFGWKVDDAVVQALSKIDSESDYKAVANAVRAVYLPWIEDSARHFQGLVASDGYPGGSSSSSKDVDTISGECLLFVDGLRFDVAKRLAEQLTNRGCTVKQRPVWAALPSVTATGKPAVSPVRDRIKGLEVNSDFEPVVAEGGKSLRGGYQLKKLLQDNGWEVLERSNYGAGEGNAWCEFGDIDSEGHERGWKLCKHLDSLLSEIGERVAELLQTGGWKSVRIVTDHGWLLMPGGLPKLDLPTALAEVKWGRCAVVKSGAKTQERMYPWFWNSAQHFALADGISCFRKGDEYTHGGLSLQECLNLELAVSVQDAAPSPGDLRIKSVHWKGHRCQVSVEGDCSEILADLRRHPGDKSTSILFKVQKLKEDGSASLTFDDEKASEGEEAFVVLYRESGDSETLVAQTRTVVGEDSQ